MDPKTLYKQKLVSIPEAVSMVQSNQKISTAIAASEPCRVAYGIRQAP